MRKSYLLYCIAKFSIAWLAIFVLCSNWALASDNSCDQLTETEQWVGRRLAEGNPADLNGYKGSRNIRSKCLEAMLTGDKQFPIHHHGIQIDNAVFTGKLKLEKAEVPYFVSITNSLFSDDVSLANSVFKQDLILNGSQFNKDASFDSIHVQRDASFQKTSRNKTIFNGQTSFAGAHIGRLFLANGASFDNSHNGASDFFLIEFEVGKKDAGMLCEAIVREGYELGTLKPCGNTINEIIKWLNDLILLDDLYEIIDARKHLVPTDEIKILKQRTDKYRHRSVKSDAQKESVRHLNRLTIELAHPQEAPRRITVFFTALETGHNVHLDGASFNGPVDFRSAIIGRSFYADYAVFKDISNFTGMKALGKKTTFISANFQGPFYFDKTEIAGDLIISDYAKFSGPVSFYGSTVGADLKIEKVVFDKLNAGNMTVRGTATFSNVKINTAVTFQNGNFQVLAFDKMTWPPNKITGEASEFSSDEFESPKDTKMLYEALESDGLDHGTIKAPGNMLDRLNGILRSPRFFDEVVDKKPYLTLTNEMMKLKSMTKGKRQLSFGDLNNDDQKAIKQLNRLIMELAYPLETPKRGVSIDGLKYYALSVPSDAKSTPGLFKKLLSKMHIHISEERPELKLLEKSRFNTQNYIELESFFKRSGNQDWADEVYIKGRQQELENRKPWEPGDYLTYIFWDNLAGFGRRPFRIIYVSIFILLLGAKVFSPKYLDKEFKTKWGLAEHEGNPPASNTLSLLRRALLSFSVRIGLSLDIFVPTHHPGLLDHWRRSAIPTWVLVYYYVHKFCGMILVPIAAAAFFTHLRISG